MPTIRVNDQLKLAFSFDTNPLRALGKYLQNPAAINLRNLPSRLDEMPFRSLDAGLEFETPVGLGTGVVELTVGGGLSGTFTIFVPTAEDNDLFDKAHYGEPVEVAADQAYVGVGLIASVNAGVASEVSNLSFGFEAASTTRLMSYTRLATRPEMPRVADALKTTLEEFTIPGDLHDLEEMRTGAIAVIEGSGTLTFTATANLLAVANPIASTTVPVAGTLTLKAGAAVAVTSSLGFTGEYQIRVQKIADGRVRLGYYKKEGAEFTIGATAKAGLAAMRRRTELIGAVLGAVSRDPVNEDELRKAGLSDEHIAAIAGAIGDGVNRKLELAVSAAIGKQSSREAAFLFDIDLQALTADGRRAVHDALDGNLQNLLSGEAPPAGIVLRRSVLSKVSGTTQILKLNIFGIYDLLSITRILAEGVVVDDPVSGLSILDKVTATRVQATIGRLDREKLRKLLADFFLITAAYRGSRFDVGAPELRSTHTYAELHGRTNRQTMKDNLEVGEALGLLSPAEKESALDGLTDFGRTTLVAELEYDSALCRRMFLDEGGRPRTQDHYDGIGLEALALLVQPDDPDAFRRRPALEPALWDLMKDRGQFNFKPLFAELDAVRLESVTGDYTLIRWWSKTMSDTARVLADIDALPTRDPEDNRFKKLRSNFAAHLRSVADNTKPRWSDPWGLIAMDLLTARAAEATVRITGPRVNVTRERRREAGAMIAGRSA